MSVAHMADHAAVVCDVVVESVRSTWSDDPREIVSEIRFTQVEYWKGSPSAAVAATGFSLHVPGGTIGTRSMRVAGAPEFAAGQRWVLFVLPEYRTFPVVGLWEGAFRVELDALETHRVHSSRGEPVTGVDAGGFVRVAAPPTAAANDTCVHAEQAQLVMPSATVSADIALSLDEFKRLLTPTLATSRAHAPDTPAGRRIPTHLISAPLARAASTAGAAHRAAPTRAIPSAPQADRRTLGTREPRPVLQPKE